MRNACDTPERTRSNAVCDGAAVGATVIRPYTRDTGAPHSDADHVAYDCAAVPPVVYRIASDPRGAAESYVSDAPEPIVTDPNATPPTPLLPAETAVPDGWPDSKECQRRAMVLGPDGADLVDRTIGCP
ncbi:hypothetical protein Acsp01_86430 [Actinoplanes sp. NBRC 101535]|nr:hypothetical protein Acsp01_86430 [Actinoplanes sp. NBRC 101535]